MAMFPVPPWVTYATFMLSVCFTRIWLSSPYCVVKAWLLVPDWSYSVLLPIPVLVPWARLVRPRCEAMRMLSLPFWSKYSSL
ncbi:hypothetical protein D3C81_2129960 [compost metagenome]